MAAQVPNPRTFKTWEDAFQHSVPIVRKLEQQLRSNIDENRQKLRSLVGASYRDLLGTAERIIEMDDQMQLTEIYLGNIGRKCNARAVERVAGNYERMRETRNERAKEKAGVVAQTKVLQNALWLAARTIKRSGDALLAAKLWVLARLLGKSVSESEKPPAVLEDFRRRVNTLRKSLLAYIDRALVKTGMEKGVLGHTLCAYALVTSSTSKDVLKHFLEVRYGQLDAKAESHSETDVLQMLELYSQTLVDTRALFPKLFADGMSQLVNAPLLRDAQLSALLELNLDVYEIWIAEDVRSFTPWVRHEQLLSSDVGNGLASWVRQAQKCLLEAARDCLQDETDAAAVLGTRHSVLSRYLALSSKVQNDDHSQATHDMRKVFLDRLVELVGKTAADVGLTFDDLQSGPAVEAQDMWRLATEDFEMGNGALEFRSSLLRDRHGRVDIVQTNCDQLDRWIRDLDEHWVIADRMRATRWDDDSDFELDDLSDGELKAVLSKLDPDALQACLREATTKALQGVYQSIIQHSSSSSSSAAAAADDTPAALMLRILREVDHRRRSLSGRINAATATDTFQTVDELVSELHAKLAEKIAERPLEQYHAARSTRKPDLKTRTELWDGTPPLPVQPTPRTYRLLVELQRAMTKAGGDLWSPAAVRALRKVLEKGLTESLGRGEVLDSKESHNDETAKGKEEDQAQEEKKQEGQVQTLFDMLYLERILGLTLAVPPAAKPNSLQPLSAELRADLDDANGYERLCKNAAEYWRRTYLLFGLLATGEGGSV